MRLTRKEKGAVIKGLAAAYRRSGKKEKAKILEQVVEAKGYYRRYAARVIYGSEVKRVLMRCSLSHRSG